VNKQVLLDKLSEFLMVEREAAVAEVGPEEDEHLGWAQTKLAELSLKAITQEPPPDPERLGRVVIQPDLAIKQITPPRSTSGGSPMGRSCPPRSRHQPRERRRRPARSVQLG
jgi:hypothetical protein